MSKREAIVTIYETLYKNQNPHYIPIGKALERIQSGKSLEKVLLVREGDKDAKRNLPIVLFSGEFSERKDDKIVNHSGFIVLDFDHVNVEEYRKTLCTDDFVYACWRSPSGDGIKVLVRISHPERHRDHFRALCSYFEKQYGYDVDQSGINESRACFESYDQHMCVNEDSKVFSSMRAEVANTQERVKAESYTDYQKLNIAASMIRSAEDGEKHNTLIRAGFLCGGYIAAGRMEEDEVIRILMREIGKKDIDSEDAALTALRKSLEEGKRVPIREIIEAENKIKKEILLDDMDMSFISSSDEDFDWINKLAEGKIELGLDTGSRSLDEYFRYKKEFFIFNGHANVGKTSFALYLMVNSAIRHGWKWLIYSAENKTASIKSKIMQFAGNRPINQMSYTERKHLYEWVNEHFIIISNHQTYSYYDLILFAEKTISNQHIDGFFIDPYNAIKIDLSGNSKISTHEYHYEAASELLTFSNSHNIAVWLNTHAVTEAQRRLGDDGLPIAPWGSDTEGGGKFMNRADSFGTFHRKIQSPEQNVRRTIEFHIRKVRETETGGQPTPLDHPIHFMLSANNSAYLCLQDKATPMFSDLFTMKKIQEERSQQVFDLQLDNLEDIF
jgi:hypothetical protein